MSLFKKRPGLSDGIEQAKNTPDSALIDVRTEQEYASGHVPGSINVPLDKLGSIAIPKTRPLFVYCLSGGRSAQACSALERLGYQATNIGGISGYSGPIEKGGTDK